MSKDVIQSTSGAVTGFRHEIMITTTEQIVGYRITEVMGLVRGNTIRARHIGADIRALMRNLVGGEIRDYTKLMAESREQALDRMADQAMQMGANAVIGTRITTSMLMGGAAELVAYGTAVQIEPAPAP